MLFLIGNISNFPLNSNTHNKNTRQKNDLYVPGVNLAVFKRGVNYMAIKVFNNFP